MEASHLKINPDHLRFKPMSFGKKTALRRENIKALIRSKPAGTPISLQEFARVTMIKAPSAHSLLRTMIQRGDLTKTPIEGKQRRFSYSVNEDVKVMTAPPLPTLTLPLPDAASYTVDEITSKAKDFSWDKESDSLREFITWLTA